MDSTLDSAMAHALDGLLYAAYSSHIVSKKRHPRHSDISQRNLHFVEEIKINEVYVSVWQYRGAGDSKGDISTDKRKVCPIFYTYFVCVDGHFHFVWIRWFSSSKGKVAQQVYEKGKDLRLLTQELLAMLIIQENLAATKITAKSELVQWKLSQ